MQSNVSNIQINSGGLGNNKINVAWQVAIWWLCAICYSYFGAKVQLMTEYEYQSLNKSQWHDRLLNQIFSHKPMSASNARNILAASKMRRLRLYTDVGEEAVASLAVSCSGPSSDGNAHTVPSAADIDRPLFVSWAPPNRVRPTLAA